MHSFILSLSKDEGRARSLRQHQLRQRDQLATFTDMRADRGIERAAFARVSAVDEPVRVARRRAALARNFFV
jgi:hypothetical protein